MSDPVWTGSGPRFTLIWNGQPWALAVDKPGPGLCLQATDNPLKLLALDRLSAVGRFDSEAFQSATLVEYETYRNSVRATFAPPSWAGLRIRASWSVSPRQTVDLEVQATATSVGELDGLEVDILSRFRQTGEQAVGLPISYVDARDVAAALSSYDGREPEPMLRQLAIGSRNRPLRPSLIQGPAGEDDLFYVEMVHPDDLARRVSSEAILDDVSLTSARTIRYALFGLALEKGVVLRGRLRGCWIRSPLPTKTRLRSIKNSSASRRRWARKERAANNYPGDWRGHSAGRGHACQAPNGARVNSQHITPPPATPSRPMNSGFRDVVRAAVSI